MVKVASLRLLAIFLLPALWLQAQDEYTSSQEQNLVTRYLQNIGSNAGLFRGRAYQPYTYYIEGTAFFQTNEWQQGSVCYDSIVYPGISLKMELVKDVPVIFYDGLLFPLQLPPERINWIELNGHRFVRLVKENGDSPVPETGFYDLMHESEASFWVRREKEIKSEIEDRQVRYWFEEQNDYYIQKDGEFHRIRSEGSLLRVLSDYRDELKDYLEEKQLSVRKQPETAIKAALEYFDQLKKGIQ